jgi:hypothetical protein
MLTFTVGAGAATNASPSGWRNIFWIQAGFFGITILGFFAFYHPRKVNRPEKLSWKAIFWACDPIGSLLFIVSATLMLLALDWVGGVYAWSDRHVVAPLTVGLVCLVGFGVYGELLFSMVEG